MSQTEAAVDQLISIVVPLIESSRDLAAALDAANARAIASAAELAEFRSNDAEEDARQLAKQDEDLAKSVNEKTAKLAADIAAIQNPPKVEPNPADEAEEPAAEPAPAEGELPVDEPVVVVPGEDEVDRTDQGTATEEASVIITEDPTASDVITPDANTPETQEELEAQTSRRRR